MAMSEERLTAVIVFYEQVAAREKRLFDRVPRSVLSPHALKHVERMEHIEEMCPKMIAFLEEGRREKLMRWLGFIQGTFEALSVFSLSELKDHNRPDKPAPVWEGDGG